MCRGEHLDPLASSLGCWFQNLFFFSLLTSFSKAPICRSHLICSTLLLGANSSFFSLLLLNPLRISASWNVSALAFYFPITSLKLLLEGTLKQSDLHLNIPQLLNCRAMASNMSTTYFPAGIFHYTYIDVDVVVEEEHEHWEWSVHGRMMKKKNIILSMYPRNRENRLWETWNREFYSM